MSKKRSSTRESAPCIVQLVVREPGEVGSGRQARLGLAELGDHLVSLQASGEELSEHAEACHEGVGPGLLVVDGVDHDQVTDGVTGLDREQQAGPYPHRLPGRPLRARLGGQVRQARHADGHLLDEHLPGRPREHVHQVDVGGNPRDPLGVAGQTNVSGRPVGGDRQQPASIRTEERAHSFEGTLDRGVHLLRRRRHERGGRVGDERLELEPPFEVHVVVALVHGVPAHIIVGTGPPPDRRGCRWAGPREGGRSPGPTLPFPAANIPHPDEKCRSRPVSRVLFRGNFTAATNIPLGRTLPCASSEPYPEAGAGRPTPRLATRTPPYLLLHQVGFAMPFLSPGPRCALTAPFHPCHARLAAPFGGLFSVALSRGSPRPVVDRHPALWCPDFPRRTRVPTRSSGRLRRGGSNTRGWGRQTTPPRQCATKDSGETAVSGKAARTCRSLVTSVASSSLATATNSQS